MNKMANESFDEYVERTIKQNMANPAIRAAVRREERLGPEAHRTSRAAAAMQNAALVKNAVVYHGGRMK